MKAIKPFLTQPLFSSFLGLIVLYLAHFFFFEAILNSDDRIMSYITSGVFGQASEHLLFQNILMGFLFKNLYALQQWYWYDAFMLLMLFLSHWAIFYALLRLKINFWLIFSFFVYIVLSQLSYINFTTTAAYLGIAGILLFFSLQKNDEKPYLIPLFFLLLSALIRFQSTVLVFILFTPFFLYQIWIKKLDYKKLIIFFGIGFCLILGIVSIDKLYIKNLDNEWTEKYTFLDYGRYFFDYDAIPFKPYEGVYKKYNFSENDLLVFRAYAFHWADPDFFTSQRLKNMLSEVDRFSIKYIRLRGIKEIIPKFWTIIWQNKAYLSFILAFILAFLGYSYKRNLYIVTQLLMIVSIYSLLILFLKTVHYVDYVVFSSFFILALLVTEKKYTLVFIPLLLFTYFHIPTLNKKQPINNNKTLFVQSLDKKIPYLWLTESPSSYMNMKLFTDIYAYQDYNFVFFNKPYSDKFSKKYNIYLPAKDLVNSEIVLIFTKTSNALLEPYQIYMKEHYHQEVYFEKVGDRFGYEFYKVKSK